MNAIQPTHLLKNIPESMSAEWFQTLFENPHVRIERIVSRGHCSLENSWYDQDWDEWVMLVKGRAGLIIEDQPETIVLKQGDALLIPAGVRHRVAWTDPHGDTVWLAVHAFNKTYGRSSTMEENTYRDILADAIQAEIEAHRFYQQVADRVQDSYLAEMFRDLAAEELNHRRILEKFRENPDQRIHFAQVTDYHVAETVDVPEELSLAMKPADAIALAMKKEQAAMRRYADLAAACSDPDQKKVFLELSAMERGHKAKLENAFVDIGYPEVW